MAINLRISEPVEFGKMIRDLRRDKSLTQRLVAKRAGLTVVTIARVEGGRANGIRSSTIECLVEALRPSEDAKKKISELTGVRFHAPLPLSIVSNNDLKNMALHNELMLTGSCIGILYR